MSKTRVYPLIGEVIGVVVGFMVALMSVEVVGAGLMLALNGGIVGLIIGTTAVCIILVEFCVHSVDGAKVSLMTGAILGAIGGVSASHALADTLFATFPIFIIPIFAIIGYISVEFLVTIDERTEAKRLKEEKKKRMEKMKQEILDKIHETIKEE